MRKVNPTIGRKASEGRRARSRAALLAARARGVRIGAPLKTIKHVVVASVCEMCSQEFLWTLGYTGKANGVKHQKTGRFCSKRCLVKWLHKYRTVVSNVDEVKRLYWEEGMSLWEIARQLGVTSHKTISAAMARANIWRRPKKNFGKRICIERGCDEPTFKIIHSNNRSPYGRRCEKHWLEHRQKLHDDYYARVGGQYPEKIKQSIAKGNVTSEAIAEDIGLSARTVWITLGRMRMVGAAEIVGSERSKRRNRAIWGLTTSTQT